MDEKVYGYMDWPRIEAIVYGEETAPRDVMGPRITQDGVLIQGFFPDAEEVNVISGKKTYVCEKEDEPDILQYCFLYARCRNTDFL